MRYLILLLLIIPSLAFGNGRPPKGNDNGQQQAQSNQQQQDQQQQQAQKAAATATNETVVRSNSKLVNHNNVDIGPVTTRVDVVGGGSESESYSSAITGPVTATGGAGGAGGLGGAGGAGGAGGLGGAAQSTAIGGEGGEATGGVGIGLGGAGGTGVGGTGVGGEGGTGVGGEGGAGGTGVGHGGEGGKAQGGVANVSGGGAVVSNSYKESIAMAAPLYTGECTEGVSGSGEDGGISVTTINQRCEHVDQAALWKAAYEYEVKHNSVPYCKPQCEGVCTTKLASVDMKYMRGSHECSEDEQNMWEVSEEGKKAYILWHQNLDDSQAIVDKTKATGLIGRIFQQIGGWGIIVLLVFAA